MIEKDKLRTATIEKQKNFHTNFIYIIYLLFKYVILNATTIKELPPELFGNCSTKYINV